MAKKKSKIKEMKQEKEKKQEKQTKLVLIFLIIILISVLFSYLLFLEAKKFSYAGLDFQKIKQGSLILYKTRFPIRDVTGEIASYFYFYFREDPRKLKNIAIEGSIRLKKTTAIAANADIVEKCDDSILSGTSLALYLENSGVSTFSAGTNKTEALLLKRMYVSCDDTEKYSVIVFQNSNESKITQKGDCYILNVKDCEIMNVTERFMIGLYSSYNNIKLK